MNTLTETEKQEIAVTAICVFAQVTACGDFHCTDEQHAAICHYFSAYMNTGADEDEAAEMARSTFIQCAGKPDRIYSAALPYEDM